MRRSLEAVTAPRFFETERGFQGDFAANLRGLVASSLSLAKDCIIESEYQKSLKTHRTAIRPDVVVHIPTVLTGNRTADNFLAIELKLRATAADAQSDFESLDTLMDALEYETAAFINISSDRTHADVYRGGYPDRIHCFAIEQTKYGTRVRCEQPGHAKRR
ncbi:MAG: hypothetical protein ABI672_10025 [Vicinamibacteria bacterium]